MRRIVAFNNVTIDGFFAGPHGEIDWFKVDRDPEYDEFSRDQSKTGDAMILGRTTYQMMESYWPTPEAMKSNPDMAEVMNGIQKIVFSRTLRAVDERSNWRNVRLLHEIRAEEILKLKEQKGKNIAILGSGSIVRQLTNLGLIDEYQLLVHPVILGAGKSLFAGVETKSLRLIKTRAFKNGIVWLCYQSSK
ncbi:MAG TPA: dihydrofolate reductase family protein [Methanothrix sp.]|nr:dihydrofolate reductase family protein [Methanothrix sp.]